MTHEQIFKNAKWIERKGSDAPLFRKTFNAVKGEKAEIIICGLGFFKLFINGKKVSDDLLVPNATCYSKRDLHKLVFPLDDEFSFRIYAMKYDVSNYLREGENTLTVMLGNGYYNQNVRMAEGDVVFGTPKLCYILEKESGNIISDESTLSHRGFITFNNLYHGEKHDYTLYPDDFMLNGFSGDGFAESDVIPAPESEFFIQFSPADKVTRTLTPVLLKDEGETKLYDAGENTVGYAVFKCNEKDKTIKVNYAEEIYEENEWFGIHFKEGYQEEQFVTDGTDREYIPHFTWHGFRYFRVNADVEPVRVDVVHSDCPVTSSFESDNENLNWLYEAYIRTQLGNMHSGVPSDCPHRERLGYTGDGMLCAETAMMLLDSREFYRKWLYDVADSQCKKTGHVPHTAPLMGGGGGPSGWGGAMIEVPYKFYKMYGDKALLEEFFPKMLKFLDYLESRSENGLVWREEENGWCLGDWCSPAPMGLPEAFVNTALYIRFMNQMIEVGEILGKSNETEHLKDRIEKSSHSLKIAYYNPWNHHYCGNVQGASALAFSAGLANDDAKNRLISKYKNLGMFDTGIFATEALIGYLFEVGENQLAFDLLSNDKEVSFGHMKKKGATTIWENWNGQDSRNHPMFGAVTKYIFMYLLGIRQAKGSVAYKDIVISPCFVEGMNEAKGHITTENGIIRVEYKKDGDKAVVKAYAEDGINAVFEYGEEKIPFSGEREFTVNLGE
ncbi:MAG: family 78 glycoside hydrolase catalytic domain [Clostridia bacterium]|nr:family 78 glycoside hydrolase catalytic domain [Clostridia bacterium]